MTWKPVESFDEWFERHGKPYEVAVVAGGGTPWPFDDTKRAKVAEALGLPAGTSSMELRRALWERRR